MGGFTWNRRQYVVGEVDLAGLPDRSSEETTPLYVAMQGMVLLVLVNLCSGNMIFILRMTINWLGWQLDIVSFVICPTVVSKPIYFGYDHPKHTFIFSWYTNIVHRFSFSYKIRSQPKCITTVTVGNCSINLSRLFFDVLILVELKLTNNNSCIQRSTKSETLILFRKQRRQRWRHIVYT